MRNLFLLFCFFAVRVVAQPEPIDRWKKLFNTNIDSIEQAYAANPLLITTDGTMFTNAKSYYTTSKKEVKEIKSAAIVHQEQVSPDVIFEIIHFISVDQKKFSQLVIIRNVNGVLLREVEMVSANDGQSDMAGVKEARDLWMKLCNSHRADELVRKMYSDNAIYFNNHRYIAGTAAITGEYRYMDNPSYTLTLTPIALEAAGRNLVFEIGQCSGSYQGKYVLVWKKIENHWKVIFDSN